MIIGTVRRILREDIARAGEVPKWVDALLSPLNEFIDKVSQAISGNITFKDNFSLKVKTQSITYASSPTEYEISPASNIRVTNVIPGDASGVRIIDFGWTRKANGNIGLKVKWLNYDDSVPAAGDKNDFTFYIFLG